MVPIGSIRRALQLRRNRTRRAQQELSLASRPGSNAHPSVKKIADRYIENERKRPNTFPRADLLYEQEKAEKRYNSAVKKVKRSRQKRAKALRKSR